MSEERLKELDQLMKIADWLLRWNPYVSPNGVRYTSAPTAYDDRDWMQSEYNRLRRKLDASATLEEQP